MIEKEAKTKWCPMAANTKSLVVLSAAVPAITSGAATIAAVLEECIKDIDKVEKCIASDCMCWEWEKGAELSDAGEMIVIESESKWRNARGHCGLAGAK